MPRASVEPRFMVFLLSGSPSPHPPTFSVLLSMSAFFLKHSLTSPTSAGDLISFPFSVSPDLVYTSSKHSFILPKRYWFFFSLCTKHCSKKLVGDTGNEINFKMFIKCQAYSKYRGDIGCSLLRIRFLSFWVQTIPYHKAKYFLRLISLI